jgi:hypothetical protein
VLALFAPYAVALLPPVAVPIKFSIPVLLLFIPFAVATLPPVALPVRVNVPAALLAPYEAPALPAVALPVTLTTPVLVLLTAIQPEPPPTLPPKRFPVTVKVPVELLTTAIPLATAPAVMFPTMLAVAGEAAEKVSRVEVVKLLCVTFAVKVTPLLRTYVPVPAFESSVQVTFAVIVMTCVVEALASSAALGTMPPTQVAPALKLPVAAERMSAIFYSPFA